MKTTRASKTSSGTDMAQRASVALNRLVRMFVETFDVSQTDAEALASFYRQQKLVKIDPVSGGYTVGHGRLLSNEAVAALLPKARELYSK